MKKFHFALLLVPLFAQLYGQPIYVSNFLNVLYRFNPDNCAEELVVGFNIAEPFAVSDIAFLPSGTLYGLSPFGGIYTIDTISGTSDLIHQLPLYPQPDPLDPIGYTSMVGYVDGLLYIASTVGDLYTYDPSTDTENYLGLMDYEPAGDLIWIAGDLYVSVTEWDIVRVDLNNLANSSVVLSNNDDNFLIYGLAPLARSDCSVETYLFSTGPNFLTTNVFNFGVAPSELTYNCTSTQLGVLGATSMSEFVVSPSFTYDIQALPGRCDSIDGRIEVIVSGGSPPFQYSLDGMTFQSSNVFEALANGTYMLSIRDQGNCTVVAQVTLEDDPPEILGISTDTVSCQSTDGVISVTAAGNNPPLEYSLDDETYQSEPFFANLPAGSYTVYVRDSNFCTEQSFTTLAENVATEIVAVDVTPVACLGDRGSISVSVSPMVTGLLYSLDSIEPLNFQQDSVFTNLNAGTYVVTAGNDEFCYDRDTVTIAPGQSLLIDSITTISADCEGTGGVITVFAQEENGPIVYSLNGSIFQDSPVFTNLSAGSYTVAITDSGNCADSTTTNIQEPLPPMIMEVLVENSKCSGQADGSIEVVAQGQNTVLLYSLDNTNFQASPVFSDLGVGDYTVCVTDEDGCLSKAPVEIIATDELALLNTFITDSECGVANGSIDFEFNRESNIVAFLNGASIPSGLPLTGLMPGTYALRLEDENGCFLLTSATLESLACKVYVPNGFSPNGDGVNDTFRAYTYTGFSGQFLSLYIFDRWGGIVYRNDAYDHLTEGWDGTHRGRPVDPAVFAYVLDYLDESGNRITLSGDISVIR